MRIYEELFIVRPDAPEEEIDAFIEQMKQIITSGGGTVDKADKWGVRKLAYRVEKRDEGFYVLLQVTCGAETIKELERRLRVADLVLKFLTVRIDERLKKIEKRRKEREKRAKRKPAPVAPSVAPSRPAAPAEPVPGAPVAAAEPAEKPAEKPVEKEA
ncbi:MAG TPA: 30S ribosomal protein S6 [Bryobacteraceae bacterium]|nr:30S ribosomal protein S6 [Bryobacteraceae bacterium]